MAYKRPHKKMRKNILMLLVFIAINTSAQTFELTARGFVDSTNIKNDYIIVPFEGKSQCEIFNLALAAIGKNFVSPKDRISKVEYSQINLNGTITAVTYLNRMGMKLYFDLYYNLILEFKDGRMKINGPIINDIVRDAPFGDKHHMFLTETERGSAISGHKALFKKNGKVNEKKHKENIEKAINTFISRVIGEMSNANNSDW
jgi:hypothetical protein